MATAGELQSTQEAPLPTQHQQGALTPNERRQGQADDAMDGEPEEPTCLEVGGRPDEERSSSPCVLPAPAVLVDRHASSLS